MENTELSLLVGWAVPTIVGNVRIYGSSGEVGAAHPTERGISIIPSLVYFLDKKFKRDTVGGKL